MSLVLSCRLLTVFLTKRWNIPTTVAMAFMVAVIATTLFPCSTRVSSWSIFVVPKRYSYNNHHHIGRPLTACPFNPFSRRTGFCLYQQPSFSKDDENIEDEMNKSVEYFDDFDFFIGEEEKEGNSKETQKAQDFGSSTTTSTLQQRLQELVVSEQRNQQRITSNWKEGYWNVWGCSLDPFEVESIGSEENDSQDISIKTVITCIRLVCNDHQDDDDDDKALLIVGRSDGSICWIQMDTTIPSSTKDNRSTITYFENKLSAKATDNGGMTIATELQRSNENVAESDKTDVSPSTESPPFDIVAQISTVQSSTTTSGPAIVDMLVLDKAKQLWTISQGSPNIIQVWKVSLQSESGLLLPALTTQATTPIQILDNVHTSPIVAMKVIPTKNDRTCVLSVSDNGQVVVWVLVKVESEDLDNNTEISILWEENVLEAYHPELSGDIDIDSDNDSILSMDVDGQYLYLGSASGKISIYSLSSLLSSKTQNGMTLPLVKNFIGFTSYEQGVSSILVTKTDRNFGSAITSAGREPILVLIAGSQSGELKQWQLIPAGSNRLEYWPKMSSQKLQGKAHVFETQTVTGAILGLLCIQNVIMAATDEILTVFDPTTGKSLYDMHGLDFACTARISNAIQLPRPSLVAARDSVLVTNGMGQYVCVHDFAMDRVSSENAQDMIERNDNE